MKTLLVLAHPRRKSLSGAVAEAFAAQAVARGHEIDWADLVSEGFDPVLREADEPDWNDPQKLYSPAVQAEMARVERNEATVMIYPVWWWSMPAILKGWIDRVWNQGWAYGGGATYPHRRVWMLAIAGADRPVYTKRDYDRAMQIQLDTGILDYCGVTERRLELLYGATEGPGLVQEILRQATELGAAF
ncbi:MAG TPA: NAD(P)H oxidoreductase [Candidatus Nitrosotalea sp.]|jgi:NAD(P)H dehydrogenase (quinone)|nr:NAD(P)H oxidoreductase [Candidatus Nitrosotalea sp.]